MSTNFGVSLEQRLNPSIARFDQFASLIMQSLRVALPGIVQSFTPGPPATVSVLIATNEYMLMSPTGDTLNVSTESQQLAQLSDVPILVPSAGGWSLTFPIQAGDECLVVFADTQLDVWFQNGGLNNNPMNQRRHSLSDGVAVFGLRSAKTGLTNYSTSSAQLRSDDGSVVIDLAGNQVTITAPNVVINTSTNVTINAADSVAITGSSAVNISGTTTIESRVFLAHEHHGVTPGGGISGPVV